MPHLSNMPVLLVLFLFFFVLSYLSLKIFYQNFSIEENKKKKSSAPLKGFSWNF